MGLCKIHQNTQSSTEQNQTNRKRIGDGCVLRKETQPFLGFAIVFREHDGSKDLLNSAILARNAGKKHIKQN